ncbi:calx-beta domain protein [Kordia sp. SMS9]|uniref:Calx-beta domain-containing protein n=1 Tax=Kordia sp. SMS9 TaxID=2282170 RepID=UPI000E0D72FD|nr:Calx-beta domain-containing protein [Kordia sp. SMS9]AXG72369.1 calx-beta domain protein [Kordia sp. SMS9]
MKKSLVFLCCMLLLCTFSCENDDNVVPQQVAEEEQPVIPINFEENFGTSVNARFLGRIVDEENNPIQGATIRIGTTVTTTDLFGMFSASSSEVFEKFAYITAEKAGYMKGSRALAPSITEVNRIEIMLLNEDIIATVTSGETAMVNLSNGTEVALNGNYTRQDGSPYTGQVDVVLKHLSPEDENMAAMMPGMLFAQDGSGDAVTLETYGMLAVELMSSTGELLQLSDGSTSQITMPVPANSVNPPATIPLWHFDEELGYWVEEGEATLQGNMYVGEVSHFSFWNYDYPYPSVYLCIKLIDEAGRPLSYTELDVYSSLLNNTGTYGFTNAAGEECGLVPEGEELTITVPNPLCPGEPFTTTIGPFTTDTDVVITVTGGQNTSTLSGTFVNCNGDNVTDGYIQLFIDGNSEIIPVTDGTINYTISYCDDIDYSLKGVDVTSNQITSIITGTLDGTETIDLGTLSSCTGFEDTDGDGVFDTFEDVNGDNDLDNDDTDDDGVPNYQDADDDGDGINTADEDYDGDNDPTNEDSDGDGTPDYLDAEDVAVFSVEALGVGCDPVEFDLDAIVAENGNDLHTYAFYLTEADALAENGPLSSPFGVSIADLNSNTQQIYVVATNNNSGQTAIGTVFLYWSFVDSDGDGLTDCEELTGIDNPSTALVPNGTSDPNDPNDPNLQPVATLSIDDVSVDENAGSVTIPVTLDVPSDVDTVVGVSTSGGTAVENLDYTATTQTLTIPAGQLSASFTVPIVDDSDVEQTESFNIVGTIASGNLLNPPGQNLFATVTINDDDVGTIFTLQDINITEDNGTANVPVTLNNPSGVDTVISISTSGGTASESLDYTASVQTLTIPAGQLSGSVSIAIIDDAQVEGNETFFVTGNAFSNNLSNQQSQAVVTILDNDTANYPTTGTIEGCANPNSDFATFDLTSMNTYYAAGDFSVIISYHSTAADAQNGINALPIIYQALNGDTIFVRIESSGGTFQVSTLQCNVFDIPIAPGNLTITECDGNADGFAVFSPSQLEPDITQAQTGLIVTYYLTQSNADSGTNAINGNSYTNTISGSETIFYRVEGANSGCFSTGTIDLIVDSGC